MPTLQSANQHRENPWLFEVEEESRVIKDQRNEGGKAKGGYNPTKYQKQCAKCLIDFSCGSSQQKYCSLKCYGDHSRIKKANPYKELKCISCLSGLGFGCKAIAKRLYKVNHATVRNIVIAKGFSRSSSKQAAIRFVDTGNKNKISEYEKSRRELIKRIDLSLKKIEKVKTYINLIIRAEANYGGGFDWRNASRATVLYWVNIDESRERGRGIAKIQWRTNKKKRIKNKLRAGVNRMIRIAKTKKNTRRTEFFLGTSFNDAKRRIESKFKKGMTWDNHGKIWEIDHIIPLSAFDFNREENLKIANHISNLQPLFVFENRRKSATIPLKHQFEML